MFRTSKNVNPRGQSEKKNDKNNTIIFWKGKEYPEKSAVAVNPNGVMPTYRNDLSFSDVSLLASEGEKSVTNAKSHNQSYEIPGNFLTKN